MEDGSMGPMDIEKNDADAVVPLDDMSIMGGGDDNVLPLDTNVLHMKMLIRRKIAAVEKERSEDNLSVLEQDLAYAKVYGPFDELIDYTIKFFESERFKDILDDDPSLTREIGEAYVHIEKIQKIQAVLKDVPTLWFMRILSKAFRQYVDSMDIKSKSLFSNASIVSRVMRALSDKYHDPSTGTLYSGGMEENAVKSAHYVLGVAANLDPKSLIDNALLHHAFTRLLYIYVLYQWFSSLNILEGGLSAVYPTVTLTSVGLKRKIIVVIQAALSSVGFFRPPSVPTDKGDVRIVASKVYSVLGDFPFMGVASDNDVAVVLERGAKTKAIEFLQRNYNDIIAERKDRKGRTIYDRAFFNDPVQIEETKKQDKLLIYMKIINQILSIKLSDLLDINRYNFRESSLASRTNTLKAMGVIRGLLFAVQTRPPLEIKLDEYSTFIMQLIWAKIQYEWRMFIQDEDVSESPMYVMLDRVTQHEPEAGRARFNFFFLQQMPPEDKPLNVEWTKTTTYVDRTDKGVSTASTWEGTHPPKVKPAPQGLDLIGILNSMLSDLR